MKIIYSMLRIAIAVYVLLAVLIFFFQRDYIYYPSLEYKHSFKTEIFSNEDEKIEVVVLNEGKEQALLYFGGNGESVVHNSPDFLTFFPEHSVYLVNYRGYAGSSGVATEQGLYSDAQFIYDILDTRHSELSVMGRSLGSSIATFLASTRAVNKLVLVTPFDSIEDIAQEIFPFHPISILLKDKYDSIARVKHIEAKTLVILAELDEVIPLENATRLIKAFPRSNVTVKTVSKVGHNNLSNSVDYYLFITKFMYSS